MELEPPISSSRGKTTIVPAASALKLTCTVHGPKPLPRSAPFSPHIILSTHVKFAAFAARQRRGYLRDTSERDLAVHLETALRGVIIGDRWPKSGVEVVVTILEGEENHWCGDVAAGSSDGFDGGNSWGMMTVLAGCITAASAAIADAGIDCVDLVSGGVAAVVEQESDTETRRTDPSKASYILDPSPSEHPKIYAACVVGYLAARDEVTELWVRGNMPTAVSENRRRSDPDNPSVEKLIDAAVQAATGSRLVLEQAVKEVVTLQMDDGGKEKPGLDESQDAVMAG